MEKTWTEFHSASDGDLTNVSKTLHEDGTLMTPNSQIVSSSKPRQTLNVQKTVRNALSTSWGGSLALSGLSRSTSRRGDTMRDTLAGESTAQISPTLRAFHTSGFSMRGEAGEGIRVAPRQPLVEQDLSRQQTSFMSRLCCGSAESAEPAPKVSHEPLSSAVAAMGISSSSIVELGPIPPASTRQLRPVQEVVVDGGTGSSASEGTTSSELAERQAARRTSAFLDNSHHSSPSPHARTLR